MVKVATVVFRSCRAARLAFTTVVAVVLAFPATGQEVDPSTIAGESESLHPWAEDLLFLRRELVKTHPDLFYQTSEKDFDAALQRMLSEVHEYTIPQFQTEVRRLLATIGDAHVAVVPTAPGPLYPIRLMEVEGRLIVVAAQPNQAELLGAVLMAVDDVETAEIRGALSKVVSHETEQWLQASYPEAPNLRSAWTLVEIGVVDSVETAAFGFRPGGQQPLLVWEIQPATPERSPVLTHVPQITTPSGNSYTHYPVRSEPFYWYEYDADSRMLHIAYNQCQEDPEYPMDQFLLDVFQVLGGNKAHRIVIDLRRNGGGDSGLLAPLIRRLKIQRIIAERAGESLDVYALIGRRTFSSAVLNAVELRTEAGATMVGEPTGGALNGFGNVTSIELPNSGVTVSCSTRYYVLDPTGGREPRSLEPDVSAPPTVDAVRSGRDPAMEWIRSEERISRP